MSRASNIRGWEAEKRVRALLEGAGYSVRMATEEEDHNRKWDVVIEIGVQVKCAIRDVILPGNVALVVAGSQLDDGEVWDQLQREIARITE